MTNIKSKIPSHFNPEEFRKGGHTLVDTLSDYLEDSLSGKKMPVLPWNDPEYLTEYFSFDSAGGEKESMDSFIRRIIDKSIHIHHPRYIGHQVTSPLPAAVLVVLHNTS
jgi:L-2,4-diaminobutyrate decarboxylase